MISGAASLWALGPGVPSGCAAGRRSHRGSPLSSIADWHKSVSRDGWVRVSDKPGYRAHLLTMTGSNPSDVVRPTKKRHSVSATLGDSKKRKKKAADHRGPAYLVSSSSIFNSRDDVLHRLGTSKPRIPKKRTKWKGLPNQEVFPPHAISRNRGETPWLQ